MNPYVFTGNYLQALKAVGLPPETEQDTTVDIVNKDLPRQLIIGTPSECKRFSQLWQHSKDIRHYKQGNMDARGLAVHSFLSSCLNKPFQFPETYGDMECHEFKRTFQGKESEFSAAYLDDKGQPSGFCAYFNPLNPAQWIIAIIRNAHLAPKKREVFLMSSMKSFASNGPGFKASSEKKINSTIRKAFHSRLLGEVFGELIDAEGHLKLASLPSRNMGHRPGDPDSPLLIEPEALKAFHSQTVKQQDPAMPIHYFLGNYPDAVLALGFSQETLDDVFLTESADIHKELAVDEHRDGSFIGSSAEYQQFWAAWKKAATIDNRYCQGNRDGSVFTGKPYFMNWMTGRRPDGPPEFSESQQDIRVIRHTYLDNQENPCGFSVVYNEKNPNQWLIVVIRNGHLAPRDRQVQLFSTVVGLKHNEPDFTAINQRISSALDSETMTSFFSNVIRSNGALDTRQFKVLEDSAFLSPGKRFDPLRARMGISAIQLAGIALNKEREEWEHNLTMKDYKELTPTLNAVLYVYIETLDRDYAETVPEPVRRTIEDALQTLFAIPHSEQTLGPDDKFRAIQTFHEAVRGLKPYEMHAPIKAMIYECNLAVIKLYVNASQVPPPYNFKLLQEGNKGKPFRLKQLEAEEQLRLKPRLQAYLHQQLDALDKKAKALGKKRYPRLQKELEGTITKLKENIDTLFAIQHTPLSDKMKTQGEQLMIHECKFLVATISDDVKKHRGIKRIFNRILDSLEKRGYHPRDRGFFKTSTQKLVESVQEVFGKTDTPPGKSDGAYIYPVWRG